MDRGVGSKGAVGEHGVAREVDFQDAFQRTEEQVPVDCKVAKAWSSARGGQVEMDVFWSGKVKIKQLVHPPVQANIQVPIHANQVQVNLVVQQEVDVVCVLPPVDSEDAQSSTHLDEKDGNG